MVTKYHYSHASLGLEREIWHSLRKPALIFLNDYVPTPNLPDFKGLIMRNFQYEIKKLPKS